MFLPALQIFKSYFSKKEAAIPFVQGFVTASPEAPPWCLLRATRCSVGRTFILSGHANGVLNLHGELVKRTYSSSIWLEVALLVCSVSVADGIGLPEDPSAKNAKTSLDFLCMEGWNL